MGYFNATTNANSQDSYGAIIPTTTTAVDVIDEGKYVSDEAFIYIVIFLMTVVTGLISILGVVTNILNIIVFIRQGMTSDSSTVCLFSLAIVDLLSVASTLWMGIFYALFLLGPSDLAWNPYTLMSMGGAWPHLIFSLITRMLTALISFERCFCVVFPFKVKTIFTPRISSILVSSIFAYFILTYSPFYILNTFHYVTDPETNRTHLILITDPRWYDAQMVLTQLNLFALNFLSVAVVLVCTTITVSRVKLSSAWRDSMSTNSNSGNHGNTKSKSESKELPEADTTDFESNSGRGTIAKKSQPQPQKLSNSRMQREKKMVRMITLLSWIFLACYMPNILGPVLYSYDNEIRTDGGGKYQNLSRIMYCSSCCSDAINSSINIFIYYKMSSKYKKEFDTLFGLSEK